MEAEGVQDPLSRSIVPSISPVSIHLKLVIYITSQHQPRQTPHRQEERWWDFEHFVVLVALGCLFQTPLSLLPSSTEGFNRAYNQSKLCSMNPLKSPLTFSSCLNPSYVFPQHSDQAPCGLPGWAFFGMAGLPHVGYSLISRYARQLAGN